MDIPADAFELTNPRRRSVPWATKACGRTGPVIPMGEVLMRKALALTLALCLLNVSGLAAAAASPAPAPRPLPQEDQGYVPYSPEQLDNLLSSIALYPDPLLAQLLLAATFPDQIDEAARYVRAYGSNGIDDQPWDVSVKAVAHYPSVVSMMADRLDWTTALGQAYVYQSTDVMTSVQRLRAMAQAQGNLVTTPQQRVIVEGGVIRVWPENPRLIYVPVYDPAIVYVRRPLLGVAISFGIGLLIGAWLNHDCDWGRHRVYYTGWSGGGWVGRSRPYVQVTNVYVNNRYTNVVVNRTVVNRPVNYTAINNYNSVHRDVRFDNHARNVPPPNTNYRPVNRNIDRNINTRDPRLDQYRGHQNQPQPAQQGDRVQYNRPGVGEANRTAAQPARPAPQGNQRNQPYVPARPQVNQPASPAAQRQAQPAPHAFGRGEGGFPAKEASQRGQESRASKPSAPTRPAPGRENRGNEKRVNENRGNEKRK